jgi:hypothetical protein
MIHNRKKEQISRLPHQEARRKAQSEKLSAETLFPHIYLLKQSKKLKLTIKKYETF